MTVKVYSTPSCPWCTRAKDFLSQNDVEFADLNVASDVEAAREMVAKSGQMGVPVLDINGEIIVGFNEPRIRELLKL